MNSKIYKQLDSRWSRLPYPTKNSTFGGNGCGCCACTHIAIEQDSKRNWNIQPLRRWMISQGFAIPGQGTTWSGIEATLKHIGHKTVVWVMRKDPMSKAWAELDKGNRIGVLLVDNSRTPDGTLWTSSGHYVAFTDYKKTSDGKHWFYIKDSGFRNHSGWFCYEKSIVGALPQLWIVKRLDATVPVADPLQKWYDALKVQYEWMKNSIYKWVNPPTIANSKTKSTCIAEVACALQRLGLLPEGGWFYLDLKTGKINGKSADYVKAHPELFEVIYPNKTIAQLGNSIKKGDIVAYRGTRGHIMVYMGKDKNGNPLFTTMGNKKNHPIGVNVHVPGYANAKIAMIVRLKKTAR